MIGFQTRNPGQEQSNNEFPLMDEITIEKAKENCKTLEATLKALCPNIPDFESLGIELIKFHSVNPQLDDWYQRCHWTAKKLGFHIDYYPHNENHYISGLDGLYKKLLIWKDDDTKLYWKYLDLVEECINQLDHYNVRFTFRDNDVIIIPKQNEKDTKY